MSYKKYREYVDNTLPTRDLLEQLAEECNELGKAALKAIRALGLSDNVTPVTESTALADLREEAEDVISLIDILKLADVDTGYYQKWKRWAYRLGYKEEE